MNHSEFSKKQVHRGTSINCIYFIKNVIFFQLMATGENGVSGALVQRVANKENNQEHVNVIHQLRSMEGRNAKAKQTKIKFATRMYPVQVSNEFRQIIVARSAYFILDNDGRQKWAV